MAKARVVRHHRRGLVKGIEHGVEAVGNTTGRVMKRVFR